MGKVINKQGEYDLGKSLQATRLVVEDCENVHLHYRDLRMEFSLAEFLEFVAALTEARDTITSYTPTHEGYKLLSKRTLRESPDYFPNRFVVERNVKSFHIHYKNFRLELTPEEYRKICDTIGNDRIVVWLPLDVIEAYDGGHPEEVDITKFPTTESYENHSKRIEEVRQAIREGKHIRPIAVEVRDDGTFKRRDGYCRYQAHKLEGLTKIECYLSAFMKKGAQHGESPYI